MRTRLREQLEASTGLKLRIKKNLQISWIATFAMEGREKQVGIAVTSFLSHLRASVQLLGHRRGQYDQRRDRTRPVTEGHEEADLTSWEHGQN